MTSFYPGNIRLPKIKWFNIAIIFFLAGLLPVYGRDTKNSYSHPDGTLSKRNTNYTVQLARPDTGGGILPLHNFSLTVTLKENTVYLKWLAENEMNTEKFVIQRSTDGANYTDIGYKEPSGPMNILTEYTATDNIINSSVNIYYYRIKAVDNRTNYAYSNIIPVRLQKITGINLWPNPFTTDIKISYYAAENTNLNIHILDNTGRVVLFKSCSINRGMNQLYLPEAGKLSSGYYFVRITDKGSNEVFTEKIAK